MEGSCKRRGREDRGKSRQQTADSSRQQQQAETKERELKERSASQKVELSCWWMEKKKKKRSGISKHSRRVSGGVFLVPKYLFYHH